MRAGTVVNVTPVDRRRLEAIVADRCTPQKHVWRAQIILATADGCGTAEIMRRSGKAKPVVWRWQARFMEEGVDGLLHDKTRKPGKPPLPAATVQKVVDLVTGPPPGETTHWTGRMLAKAVGISLRSVQRVLEAHHLAGHGEGPVVFVCRNCHLELSELQRGWPAGLAFEARLERGLSDLAAVRRRHTYPGV